MKKVFALFFILLLSAAKLQAQAEYNLLYEKPFSEKSGAEDILTIHKAFYLMEDKVLPPYLKKDRSGKGFDIAYRIAKSFAIDYPVDFFAGEAQHEVFGHGSRFREFGLTGATYMVSLPPPFGDGHGLSVVTGGGTTYDQNLTIDFGGVESAMVLSNSIQIKWMMDDSIHYRDLFLYVGGLHNISEYILKLYWTLHNNQPVNANNDIYAYINGINYKYPLQAKYSINRLAAYSLVNALDPFQYVAFYRWGQYIITGKEKGYMSMIKIGSAKYLPSFSMDLTPFGAEFYFNNFIKYNNLIFKIYVRSGDNQFASYQGAGFESYNLLNTKLFFLNASIDAWNQPALNLYDNTTNKTITTTNGTGGCFGATLGFKFLRNN
ncbi:MAG TPA: hypothetical protein VK890_00100, partial [Bacteroidia bacterium]|nr:hypothetical protein [Bacteroidia bacterium]